MDVETVRLVLNDSSTGTVTLTVVDALPFAKLEGPSGASPCSQHEQRSREWLDRPPR